MPLGKAAKNTLTLKHHQIGSKPALDRRIPAANENNGR
jgi:hypothetical protein